MTLRYEGWDAHDLRDHLLHTERQLDEARTEAGAWEATAQHHYKEARAAERQLTVAVALLRSVPIDIADASAEGWATACNAFLAKHKEPK